MHSASKLLGQLRIPVGTHIHIHLCDCDRDTINKKLEGLRELIMAESQEITEFKASMEASFSDLQKDIETLLGRATGLSQEDKDALTAISEKAKSLASIFDSSGGGDPV